MSIIFVGVGAIGLPMALQIKSAGHEVLGVDVADASRERARRQGIETVAHYSQAARAETVIVMVATPQQLAALLEEALPTVSGQHWIIMSTVGPDVLSAAACRLQQAGACVIDAPVTGGTARACTGELVIFAAGAAAAIGHVTPVLETMGTVKIVGSEPGEGQGIKVINQHLCAVHIVAAAEALQLARALKLDPAKVLSLVEGGAAGSWMLSDRGPRMLQDTGVSVSSAINIFVKDSGLVAEAAHACGAAVPLLQVAHARYQAAAQAGLGQCDDSRVIETWAQ
ncbi:NAD(P)-dependent oxidoreductase [Pantoea sp. Ae16]|uniref:NAD(P)-dependent oxidoreductase n=1 Tax=Pantoea sp. Ae16 TaxID=1890373 RepID=UPI0008FCFC52|nr:NAD(P)-dependent oxidoreductase [Pantoea sp. Ae16]OIX90533.1 nucleotide sugar dehydrogenase [Pantoea sp. Ae16]